MAKSYIAKNYKKIFLFLLIACAICQFALTQYFTIFQGQEHLGLDSSWEYMKVILADKHGELYPKEFMHETTQPEMERILFVLPFYKLTGNIWLAYGLGNIIITGLMLFILWKIMSKIGFNTVIKMIVINMFLCPYMANGFYVTNDLGYFSCLLGLCPYQDIAVLAFLLLLWLVILEELDKKTWIIFAWTVATTAYLCLCKGMGDIVWCGVPVFFYIMFQFFYYNDIKRLYSWKSLMLWGVIASMIVGRGLGSVIGYNYIDSGMNWINASKFWSNLGNIFLGYMAIVGGMPGSSVERSPFAFDGFAYVFGVIIFVVLLVAFIYCLATLVKSLVREKKADDVLLFLNTIIIVNTIEYMFIDTSLGQDIFELRYLLTATLSGFILVGYFIRFLDDGLLFKKVGVVVLFLSLVGMDLYSDYFLGISDNASWNVDAVKEVVESTDAELIVFWDAGKEFVKTERVLRVVDTERVYKCVSKGEVLEDFGDYNYYDDSTQYNGPSILIVNVSEPDVPDGLLEDYEEIATIGDMSIRYSENNSIDIMSNISNYN